MRKLPIAALALLCAGPSLFAQATGTEAKCATPDSVAVMGNTRVAGTTIILDAGITPGTTLNSPMVQRAIKNVYQGGQFETVNFECQLSKTTPVKSVLLIRVIERPLLDATDVIGTSAISSNVVKEKVDLVFGRPVDPAAVSLVIQHIDSIYQANGYYLARIAAETTFTENNHATIIFHIDEGSRLAVSGVRVSGNKFVPSKDIVGAMKTKPEGFFFWQKGEFDQENYSKDLGELVPQLYASRGFIDFQIQKDTLIVDRTRGKGLIDLGVAEGPQYKIGGFEVVGNRRFTSDDINRLYPFAVGSGPSLTQRLASIVKGKPTPKDVFDQGKWEEGTRKIKDAYSNEGYIYSQIHPVVDRQQTDSGPRVNLRWEVQEGTPAIVNRIEIIGNDYTTETCIRDQLSIIPGDVFRQDALINSYRSVENLGFFESPLALPETRQANDQGDVDIIFKVKEKRTGNVNFGASMGQGTGLGGFIGLDQPNLFGKCKRGSLNWQYGQFINDLQLSYTDPALNQTRTQMTLALYRSMSQYTIANLGQSTRIGGSLRFAFPFFGARWTRFGVTYGAEAVRYGGTGLLSEVTTNSCAGCMRSTLGFDLSRDTRQEMPFATTGELASFNAQFNGGPLGGTASFQRYTTEFKTFATLAKFGDKGSPNGMKLVVGLTNRGGMVAGNTGPFFSTQEFALGGVQYGEALRGYPEFSITPLGYNPNTSISNAVLQSFGNVFFVSTAEMGLRISSQFYVNLFYDAGNLWAHPRDFDPTRLFRGAGIGVGTITPLGPLGLDWAYGFDRVDANGLPDPKFMLHFRLGQIFY